MALSASALPVATVLLSPRYVLRPQGIAHTKGEAEFVQALLESIPEAHRPALDQSDAGTQVKTMFDSMKAIGSVMFPFLLTHGDTGERMRYILRALVLPDLYIPMFISGPDDGVVERMQFGGRADRRPVFTLKCRETVCPVLGIPFH